MNDPFVIYKEALRAKYEEVKTGAYANYWIRPTTANLRKLCMLIFKENNDNADLLVFKEFFGFDLSECTDQKIKKQTERFRPIQSFIKGEPALSDYTAADLLAILVDYKDRPFRKFIKKPEHTIDYNQGNKSENSGGNTVNEEGSEEENEVKKEASKEVKEEVEVKEVDDELKKLEQNPKNPITPPKDRIRKKITIAAITIVLLCSTGYIAKDICFPEKQCMQWRDSLYVAVDCENADPKYPITAFKKELLNFRRIYPKKTDSVEKDGQHIVWYSKNNGVEFFNADGVHPITGKRLRKATWLFLEEHGK